MGRSAAIFFSLVLAVGFSVIADCAKPSHHGAQSSSPNAASGVEVAPERA